MAKWLIGIFLTIIVAIGIAIGLPFEDKRTLCWDWPTTNTDGSPLTDLDGAKFYWSSTSGGYTEVKSKDLGMGTPNGTGSACYVTDLPTGTYFLTVTAYNVAKIESAFATEINKTFSKVPRPLTNLR